MPSFFRIFIEAKHNLRAGGGAHMARQKENILWNVLLGTSAYLLDSMRDRLNDNLKDVKSRARDTYETASDRVSRASDAIRGEDTRYFSTTAAVLIGIGQWRRNSR
jgi:hypothetical protein